MAINDYSTISESYASLDNTGTAFLAFREIPSLLKKYSLGNKALDYGCGSGCSTLFLSELGLDVEGVDISSEMLGEARQNIHGIKFELIKSAELPYEDDVFDIVFSSFVLFEISSKNEMKSVLSEVWRVLKPGGIFIGVTGSSELYSHNWLSLDVNFEENNNLKSGDIAQVFLKDANLLVYDYYWTDEDYLEVISESKFVNLQQLFPLGCDADGYSWQDEKEYPPYVIYVLRK
jgi:ubiquinone/menaquinone biosynthesis C-methylase UbiE